MYIYVYNFLSIFVTSPLMYCQLHLYAATFYLCLFVFLKGFMFVRSSEYRGNPQRLTFTLSNNTISWNQFILLRCMRGTNHGEASVLIPPFNWHNVGVLKCIVLSFSQV